jgi:hypothetical protein
VIEVFLCIVAVWLFWPRHRALRAGPVAEPIFLPRKAARLDTDSVPVCYWRRDDLSMTWRSQCGDGRPCDQFEAENPRVCRNCGHNILAEAVK